MHLIAKCDFVLIFLPNNTMFEDDFSFFSVENSLILRKDYIFLEEVRE
jgi:hypothetical protein